jgi:hypothetical protein
MRSTPAKAVALGGLMAALAVVIMAMGGMIPVATYVCPMLCMLLLTVVKMLCGNRIGFAWYGAVSILSMLLSPDKEAAAVFLALGYYPIIKPALDKSKLRWLWKGLLFNAVILALYWVLLHLFGMDQLAQEFDELGTWGLVIMLILGNFTFFLLDILLDRIPGRFKRKRA